jgi:hypothetical protein
MLKLKRKKYLLQKVSIEEFVLLLTDIFHFDNFLQYSKFDINLCFYFISNTPFSEYQLITKKEAQIYADYPANRNRTKRGLAEYLDKVNSERLKNTDSRMLSQLNNLSENKKTAIKKFYDTFIESKKTKYNQFPTSFYKSIINEKEHAFLVNDLIFWFIDNFNFDETFNLPLAAWAKSIVFPKPELSNTDNSPVPEGYIKIDTLPKIMQFMIECYKDKTLQKSTIENRDCKKVAYLEAMNKKINPVAIKKGITYTDRNKTINGLSKAAVEQMMFFIKEDKTN